MEAKDPGALLGLVPRFLPRDQEPPRTGRRVVLSEGWAASFSPLDARPGRAQPVLGGSGNELRLELRPDECLSQDRRTHPEGASFP